MDLSREQKLLQPGQELAGRYRVIQLLGMGAVGAVYEAEQIELQRRVALKVLRAQFFENEKMRARFLREARAAASIRHPGIVVVYDMGTSDGVTFIAMELLQGEELNDRMKRDSNLPIPYVVRVCADLTDAVAAAHDLGIVHRDLKPQNVYLASAGRHRDMVKVLDFGLAKVIDESAQLTRTGDVFGTPLYISPEQLRNAKDVDSRVDVYAIGVILYQALAGVPPFKGKNFADLVIKIVTTEATPLEQLRPDVPPQLAAIVAQSMVKNRDHRISSPHALLAALESLNLC